MVKWKSLLVILGGSHIEGIDIWTGLDSFQISHGVRPSSTASCASVECGQCISVCRSWRRYTDDVSARLGYNRRMLLEVAGESIRTEAHQLVSHETWISTVNFRWLSIHFLQTNNEIYFLSLKVDDIVIAGSHLEVVELPKRKFPDTFDINDPGKIDHFREQMTWSRYF